MTRDEILAMEPTELSLAVAERIFQAKIIGNDRDADARLLVGDFGKESWKPLKGSWRNANWRNSEEKAWIDCPKYGEDISAAWEAVNQMGEKGWMLYKIAHVLREGEINGFVCIFLNIETGANTEVRADSPTEAICKAALLAVMDWGGQK